MTESPSEVGGFQKAKAAMEEPEPPPPAVREVPEGVRQARRHLMQCANLYNMCVRCVDTVIAPKVPAIAQTSEMFQAAVDRLFVDARNLGFVEKMPQVPLEK